MWVVEQEKVLTVLELYETIKFQYNIFQSTYVPAKTEGIVAVNEAKGNKQVGAVSLLFLTHYSTKQRRAPIKASSVFKKFYNIPHPPPKDLLQENIYTVEPALELRMEFNKFMYAGMVSHLTHLQTLVCT